MSLTGEIENKSSPTRKWMDDRLNDRATRNFVREVNDQLAKIPPIVVPGANASLVGTAFDYGFRWLLGPMDKDNAAKQGALCINLFLKMETAETVLLDIIGLGDNTTDPRVRAQCCIVLAWFEQAYRASPSVLFPEYERGEGLLPMLSQPYTNNTIQQLLDQTPVPSVDDVFALLDTVPNVWGDDLQQPFILNPSFVSSHLVGKADADWIMCQTLYDCKCSRRQRPLKREDILQLLGYVLLDSDDVYMLRSAGWYYARQQVRVVYSLKELTERIFGTTSLTNLRSSFRETLCQAMSVNLMSRVERLVNSHM